MNDEYGILSLPTVIGVAFLVIAGAYGNGEERVENLIAEGYNYDEVQDCVNDLLSLIKKYGG